MTNTQFNAALARLGWSDGDVADRLGCGLAEIRVWRLGVKAVPAAIAAIVDAAVAELDRKIDERARAKTKMEANANRELQAAPFPKVEVPQPPTPAAPARRRSPGLDR